MIIKNSPLNLDDIFIVASKIIAIPQGEDFDGEINDFEVDVDFNVAVGNDDENHFKVIVDIRGNDHEEPNPGYIYDVVAEGYFHITGDSKHRDILISHSAIPFVIGQVRSYLSNATSQSPYGSYQLPLIDMHDLLKQKQKCEKTEK